ncbi:MAG: HAMP domain-containing histidine kinase [Campylobacteraceae bacterium]|jgi:signal transduction histidine kinase|nr:HAMP domain-containing histidine kinase [Campylobacteraceae bacterium]
MSSQSSFKIAAIYTAVIIAMFCIPSYFALMGAVFEEKTKSINEILRWMDANEKEIFGQENPQAPRSVRFKANIYNEKRELLFGNIKNSLDLVDFKIYSKYPNIYYQKEIKVGKNLFYMIVEKQLNYNKIVFIAAMLFLFIPFIIFFMSDLFIKVGVHRYQKIQKYMDDFFNDTIHELKTPLGVIKINLELMNEKDENSKYIQRIKSALKQIQMAYEDIEYYIKHKRVSYEKEIIDFSEFLNLRMSFFEDIAMSKSISIKSDIKPNILIYINKMELQRLIDNNISNALKYSFFEGHVEVVLRKNENAQGVFLVRDEGEGIRNTKNIFERFKRENTTEKGFGLGLNIVQNICKENGICIDVKSAKDKGSIFTYTFNIYKK